MAARLPGACLPCDLLSCGSCGSCGSCCSCGSCGAGGRSTAIADGVLVEAGAYPVGIWVAQVIEYGHSLLPGAASGVIFSRGLVGVAEAGQRLSPQMQVVGVTKGVDGLLVADDGLGVLAQVMVGGAEAVQGGGPAGPVPQLAMH